jgi:hypothetical protein
MLFVISGAIKKFLPPPLPIVLIAGKAGGNSMDNLAGYGFHLLVHVVSFLVIQEFALD